MIEEEFIALLEKRLTMRDTRKVMGWLDYLNEASRHLMTIFDWYHKQRFDMVRQEAADVAVCLMLLVKGIPS